MTIQPIEAEATPAPSAAKPDLLTLIRQSLDDDKAIDPVVIDLTGKTSIADHMIVVSGTSQRHLASMAQKLIDRLKEHGFKVPGAEGLTDSNWVLIDAGDVIVHIFRAETRAFYDLERLWSIAPTRSQAAAG